MSTPSRFVPAVTRLAAGGVLPTVGTSHAIPANVSRLVASPANRPEPATAARPAPLTQQLIDVQQASRLELVSRPPSNKGRDYALEYLKKFKPGTMGHLVFTAVRKFQRIFGNVASADIGAHYESIAGLLELPVTSQRIRDLAVGETAYWRSQDGAAYVAGCLLTAEGRVYVLECQRATNARAGILTKG